MMAAMRANTKRASCPNFPDLLGHPERRLPESKDLARSPARLSAHEWQPKRRVQEQEDRFDSQPNEIENFCTRGGPRRSFDSARGLASLRMTEESQTVWASSTTSRTVAARATRSERRREGH